MTVKLRLRLVTALFVALPLILAACGGGNTPTNTPAPTKAAPAPTTVATAAPTAAAAVASSVASAPGSGATVAAPVSTTAGADPRGPSPAKRGGGGTLHLLWWQAPTVLNFHLAANTKDWDASRIVSEPLVLTSLNGPSPDVPVLAKEIPSVQNGELTADGLSVTYKLKEGVKWSDGTPFTAEDFKATWQYVIKPENGATDVVKYQNIATVETPDATTIKITFKAPTALWYNSGIQAVLQKAQLAQCINAQTCPINTAPIGTGPFKVKSFASGDIIQYVLNENYREANAPYFDAVEMKGGGDAGTAAKAVQTGQADFAWNLQLSPDILKGVTDAGKRIEYTDGLGTELIYLNFTDPGKEVDGEKSSVKSKHPLFADPKVREAVSWLVDRDNIAKTLYGPAGSPGCNILQGVPAVLKSPNTKCGFDIAKANQILDDAGWKKGADGIREKDGVKMRVVFAASINPVREKQQQVIKQAFQQAGIAMEIKNADAGVFYGRPDNPDQFYRFENDMELNTRARTSPDAEDFFSEFTTENIPQKANNWGKLNIGRFSDPDYDKLFVQLARELDPQKRVQLEIQLNDFLTTRYVRIPIVDRATANAMRPDLVNTSITPWDTVLWNIAYWQIKR